MINAQKAQIQGGLQAKPKEWAAEPASALKNLDLPVYVLRQGQAVHLSNCGTLVAAGAKGSVELLAQAPALDTSRLGDARFGQRFGATHAYFAGSMANGISSAEMVIALGKAGYLASFGAGGLETQAVLAGLEQIQAALPDGPYAVNLIHSPNEAALESGAVDLFLKRGVKIIEASAYLDLTAQVVRYRVAGLAMEGGRVVAKNQVIAKVSRREVAERFMRPAPERFLGPLVEQGLITAEQASWAAQVPMADAVSVEADSGGHTDNRPLVNLLPSLIALRNEIQAEMNYPEPILIGAGGGIGTPEAVLGALSMGAAYIVTGSVNQACVESGTSDHVRTLLAQAAMADVIMAPASDMFEQGVKLQVLRRGTLFAMRAQKLYEWYSNCANIDEIPSAEREKLEKQIFQKPLEQVWADCVDFFNRRDPAELAKAQANPKKKMALIFRWYLGQSSHWAKAHTPGREMDYQIWTGPAMGAFNDWVRGSSLEVVANRKVVAVAEELLRGAAYLARLRMLEWQGLSFDPALATYRPR
ncbi:MAG: PfaD family polyunsaturated fatty acid/polyketide biosynthesis protein [bacterium]|nr:PfaD family polyunsaturated fatty acid/polyketide biosynthesis protein [bacterium]